MHQICTFSTKERLFAAYQGEKELYLTDGDHHSSRTLACRRHPWYWQRPAVTALCCRQHATLFLCRAFHSPHLALASVSPCATYLYHHILQCIRMYTRIRESYNCDCDVQFDKQYIDDIWIRYLMKMGWTYSLQFYLATLTLLVYLIAGLAFSSV